MSIVASRWWSGNFATLKRLYVCLILPKLNYAGFLIQAAARTYLNAIDRIQYSAARIMLGALKCTQTSYVEIEANLMSLPLMRKESILK